MKIQTLRSGIRSVGISVLLCAVATASSSATSCSKKEDGKAPQKNEGSEADVTKVEPIRVTGIPDENPTQLAREYAPMVELLQEALGAPVSYVPVTDYGAAVQALAANKVDFAWLGGFTHVQARNMADVVPLVMRDIDRKFHSVFVASKTSGINNVSELAGKKFAFGSKSSTSGHLMPRHFLSTQHNIDPDKDFAGPPVFSGAHDATAKMVESGKVDAGALNKQVWDRMVKEGEIDVNKVDVIWKTPPYVDYVWTARTKVAEPIRIKFAQAFLKLTADNPKHKLVLERMGALKYVPAAASDFDAIEAVAKSTGMLK